MNIADARSFGAGRLAENCVPDAVRDASLLLTDAIGRDTAFLYAHPEYQLSQEELDKYTEMIGRRAEREPLQYIVGRQEFFGLDFRVTPAVLIPRPETEMLVQQAIDVLAGLASPRFLEIGVGSGCISVSILKNVPQASALAADISEAAIEVAAGNAARHGVADRIEILISDVYAAVAESGFDLIVSNPPYVPIEQLKGLQPEVRDHEPHIALTDGSSGLSIVERIVTGASEKLRPGGQLLVEIGLGQAEEAMTFINNDWESAEFVADLQKIPRMLAATLGGKR